MRENQFKKIGLQVIFWLGLTLLFSISAGGTSFLFSGNQNTKFLFGLADAGWGDLAADWMANTKDPLPIYSFLVKITAQYLHPYFFYAYQVLLNGLFLFSVVGIIDHMYQIKKSKLHYLTFLSICLLTISSFWPANSQMMLYEGVANQFIGFNNLLPNSFGFLLFFSLYLYLKEKRIASILAIAGACYFHSAYLIGGASMVAAYMLIDFLEKKDLKQIMAIGAFALVLVLPVVIYNYRANSDATIEQIQQAAHIVVNLRIPGHTVVSEWWDQVAFTKIVIMAVALAITYRSKMFPLLATGFVFSVVPIIVLAIRPSNQLNALQLWRVSVFFVPLSTMIILGWLISNLPALRDGKLSVVQGATILLLAGIAVAYGVEDQISEIDDYNGIRELKMMHFVDSVRQPGDLYLVPTQDLFTYRFRLEAGAPIFVNWKTHPWNAVEVLEWYKRIQLADRFYRLSGSQACDLLAELQTDYDITHVMLNNKKDFICAGELIYQDDVVKVYELQQSLQP